MSSGGRGSQSGTNIELGDSKMFDNQTEVTSVNLVLSKYLKSFEILTKVDRLSEKVRIG